MTNADVQLILPLLIPVVTGVLIPFIVNAINRIAPMSQEFQSFVYIALSALGAVIPTVSFDNDLKGYLIALGIAWLASMRTHYTTIPDAVISPYSPRHARKDPLDGPPLSD